MSEAQKKVIQFEYTAIIAVYNEDGKIERMEPARGIVCEAEFNKTFIQVAERIVQKPPTP